MSPEVLSEQLNWLKQNQIYPRYLDLVEIGENNRIYGLSYVVISNNLKIEETTDIYVKRGYSSANKIVDASQVRSISYRSYITLEDFFQIQRLAGVNICLPALDTMDSVYNAMSSIIHALFENDVVIEDEEIKRRLKTLYQGVKYYREMFILPHLPDWWEVQ